MPQVRIDFQRRGKAETFSRARVQLIGNGIQLALGIPRQIRALRQILAQQAIGILVSPALPRAVWIGKEHLDREMARQPLMVRHRGLSRKSSADYLERHVDLYAVLNCSEARSGSEAAVTPSPHLGSQAAARVEKGLGELQHGFSDPT